MPGKHVITLIFALSTVFFVTQHAAADPDLGAILKEIDRLDDFGSLDFSCIYTIVAEKPGEETSVTEVRLFRRDRKKQFVLLILKPEVEKGQGYLQLDENVWFYDPESRKFSHSSLKENIQGSEAKSSDLNSSSLIEDYTVTSWTEGTLGKYQVYILDLKANHDEVSYPYLKLWVRKDVTMVLKVENYSLSNRLMRTAFYPAYTRIGGKLIPSTILLRDELKEGEKTQVTMKKASVASIPDYVFTKSYLERVNR